MTILKSEKTARGSLYAALGLRSLSRPVLRRVVYVAGSEQLGYHSNVAFVSQLFDNTVQICFVLFDSHQTHPFFPKVHDPGGLTPIC